MLLPLRPVFGKVFSCRKLRIDVSEASICQDGGFVVSDSAQRLHLMICTTPSQWQTAIGRVQKKVADLPALAQFQVAQEALYVWQWAKATWSQTDDYWTGRYRGSITVGVGAPDDTALPPHPEHPEWPHHPKSPYEPQDIDELMARIRPSEQPQTVFVSVAVSYAPDVESHVHPRAIAAGQATTHPYDWATLAGPLTE